MVSAAGGRRSAGISFERFVEHLAFPAFTLDVLSLASVLLTDDLLSPDQVTSALSSRISSRNFFDDGSPAKRPPLDRAKSGTSSQASVSSGGSIRSERRQMPAISVPSASVKIDEEGSPPKLASFPSLTKPQNANKAWRGMKMHAGAVPLLDLVSPQEGHIVEDMLKQLCVAAQKGEEATLSVEVSLAPAYTAGDRASRHVVLLIGQLIYAEEEETASRILISCTGPSPHSIFSPPVKKLHKAPPTPGLHFDVPTSPTSVMNAARRLEGVSPTFIAKAEKSECGRLFLNHPWEDTLLGPLGGWSSEVMALLDFVFQSPYMAVLWLSEAGLLIYNDVYAPALGVKHPSCFGAPGRDSWSEVWHQLGPIFEGAKNGESSYFESSLYFLQRDADKPAEECYYDFSFTPIHDSEGRFLAALHIAVDTTKQSLLERYIRTLRNINAHTATVADTQSYLQNSLKALDSNPFDLPFVAFYSGTSDKDVLHLKRAGTLGIPDGHPVAPLAISLRLKAALSTPSSGGSGAERASQQFELIRSSKTPIWPIAEALSTGQPILVDNIGLYTKDLKPRGWAAPSTAAVVLPIVNEGLYTICVAGCNPHRPFNERYSQFMGLLSRQLATGIAIVRTYESAVAREAELLAIDRAKTRLFNSLSHELRSPLTLVLGPLEDLLDRPTFLSGEVLSALQLMLRNALRLKKLINSFLDFSRMESGRSAAAMQAVDLGKLTHDIATLFTQAVQRAGLRFVLDIPRFAQPPMYTDPELYETIVCNLLANALKYTTNPGGSITVRVSYTSKEALLSVADTGCGISEEDQPLIFERFHRAAGNARSFEGSGIGLALVQEATRMLGGQIELKSKLTEGSTFTVVMPLIGTPDVVAAPPSGPLDSPTRARNIAGEYLSDLESWRYDVTPVPSSPASAHETSQTASPAPERKPSLLVVDDNPDMRAYCRAVLSDQYHVDEAPNGRVAFQMAERHAPDAIISDLQMPDWDGYTLLQAVRASRKLSATPIIFLSAKAEVDERVHALSSPADDFLPKPFSARELQARVAKHIAASAQRMQLSRQVLLQSRELLASQQRARDLELHLGTITDLSPCGIISIGADASIIYVNPSWRVMSGLPPEVEPNGWPAYCHPDDLDRVLTEFTAAVAARQPYFSVEFRWSNLKWCLAEVKCLEEPVGDIHFVACVTDTSSIKRIEALHLEASEQRARDAAQNAAALEQRAVEAEQMRRLQELSIDVSSHELRNPLSGLHQNAELIAESFKRAGQRLEMAEDDTHLRDEFNKLLVDNTESIESILLCSAHMQRISHDILAFSKANMGLLQLTVKPFSMTDLVAGVLRILSAEMREHGVEVRTEVGPAVEQLHADWIYADGHRLSQVLINLLTNAVRFIALRPVRRVTIQVNASLERPAPPEGSMRVGDAHSSPDDELWVSLAVADTGPGLSPAEMSKLFRRFAQANPQQDSLSGFGLGLFVSRKVLELHQGYIEVESVKGEGTTFRFGLPTRRAEPTERPPPLPAQLNRAESVKLASVRGAPSVRSSDPSRVPSPERIGRILLAEDNSVNRRVLVRQLQQNHYDCIAVQDGLEAVQAYEREWQSIDAFLCDAEMPVMGGLEAIAKIREIERQNSRRHLPSLCVTGNARDEQVEACRQAGFDEVAVKPYDLKALLRLIEEVRQR